MMGLGTAHIPVAGGWSLDSSQLDKVGGWSPQQPGGALQGGPAALIPTHPSLWKAYYLPVDLHSLCPTPHSQDSP